MDCFDGIEGDTQEAPANIDQRLRCKGCIEDLLYVAIDAKRLLFNTNPVRGRLLPVYLTPKIELATQNDSLL